MNKKFVSQVQYLLTRTKQNFLFSSLWQFINEITSETTGAIFMKLEV